MLKQNIFRLRCVGWEKKGKRKREKFKGVMGSFYPLTWNRGGAGGGGERVGGCGGGWGRMCGGGGCITSTPCVDH